MPGKLAPLYKQLSALRRERWTLRMVRGGMALALTLLVTLAVDFLLDWLFAFNRPQRGVLLAAVGGIALWSFSRFVWPALVAREDQIDLALLVERREGIDSDLVAALQFDTAGAHSWGSVQLQDAVVDRVASVGNSLSVKQGLTGRPDRRMTLALVTIAGALLVGTALFPDHVAVFFNRFLLGAAHYPTRTMIDRVLINGSVVDLKNTASAAPRVPFGTPAQFEVEATGVRPESGTVRIIAQAGGPAATLVLAPASRPQDGDNAAKSDSPPANEAARADRSGALYSAELPRLVEPVSYQVFLGDAWTEPAMIEVIPLPVVSLELDQTPPVYVARNLSPRTAAGSRELSVIEGSHVSVGVRCGNKPLAKAELVIGKARYPLQPENGDRHFWTLPAAASPLERVVEPVAFVVEVVDEDGLSPDHPLRGHVRIEADRPPRIAAAAVTEKVLPAARPGIAWGAADDYGLAEVRINRQITRAGGQVEQSVDIVRKIAAEEQPQTSLRGRLIFDLGPFALSKGDQVRVTLEAIDFRGDQPGTPAHSDPIVFQVTDENGILAGLVESDAKSARQLDQIIQRQLGIGESR